MHRFRLCLDGLVKCNYGDHIRSKVSQRSCRLLAPCVANAVRNTVIVFPLIYTGSGLPCFV